MSAFTGCSYLELDNRTRRGARLPRNCLLQFLFRPAGEGSKSLFCGALCVSPNISWFRLLNVGRSSKRRASHVICGLLAGVILSVCTDPSLGRPEWNVGSTTQPRGGLAGSVRDLTGHPIPDANIVILETALGAMTDSCGQFRIRRVPVGAYHVRFMALGYSDTTGVARIDSGRAAYLIAHLRKTTPDPHAVHVVTDGGRLRSTAVFYRPRGMVFDTTGAVVPCASVLTSGVGHGTSDSTGHYRARVFGTFPIRIRAVAWIPPCGWMVSEEASIPDSASCLMPVDLVIKRCVPDFNFEE